jgi:DDE superfamily endonuclease
MDRIARLAYAILDGALIPVDRVADQKPYYSGKHRRHGVNVQVIADPAGRLIWASAAVPGSAHDLTAPGSAHDLTAARTHGMTDALTSADVMTFPDKAYQGAHGSIRTPFKRHRYRPKLSRRQKAANRCPRPHPLAPQTRQRHLKTWKILTKLRCCPRRRHQRPQSCRPSPPYTTSRTRPTEDENGSVIDRRPEGAAWVASRHRD